MSFREMLARRQSAVNSLLCVGLDPMPEKIPEQFRTGDEATSALYWMKWVVDQTAPFASMFKPNRAFWEALEDDGIGAMRILVRYIHEQYPDILVFLDCKRGDIAKTQGRYGVAQFVGDGVDGMNFNPYMGESTFSPLVCRAIALNSTYDF